MNVNINNHHKSLIAAEISEQARTYHGLTISTRYIALAMAAALSFLILTYCTAAGAGAGLCVMALEVAVGLYFAKDRPRGSWQAEAVSVFVTTDIESGH